MREIVKHCHFINGKATVCTKFSLQTLIREITYAKIGQDNELTQHAVEFIN